MTKVIRGHCHCGAVTITLPRLPKTVSQCNCTLCTRTGFIGTYGDPADITIEAADDAILAYVQGDRLISVWHCRVCGCTTHWTPIRLPATPDRMGVNMRLFDPELWARVPVEHVDGASF